MEPPLKLRWRWGARTIHLHGSLLLAALVVGVFYQSPEAVLAYVLVVLAHLGGHLFFAWRTRSTITGIHLQALGASLDLRGSAPLTRTLVGVGGVPAQLLLGLGALWLAEPLSLAPDSGLYQGLTGLNLLLGGLNLLPLPGSDGVDLWALPARAQEQLLVAERQKWTTLIDSDRQHTALPLPPPPAPPPRLHDALQAELAARDALADAGIPASVAAQTEALLAEVWSPSPPRG